ncbi:hypothetical protein QJS04_geneDACA022990 [Acorus gramineus]|uniref:Uncharacterized protein n=1 Tax=Acorus gramineus TaxID=55184 RepID=A0AAV9BQQ6_ACOGR|nr:hypothetical protein QJS04_geneDACA022990 [Acorus gramineus]
MWVLRSKSCGDGRSSSPSDDLNMLSRKPSIHVAAAEETDIDERFKCGALCLFLPGLSSKAKQVQPKVDDNDLSRTMSLEKFECVSWASSAMVDAGESDGEGGGGAHSYFDLPMELIRDGGDDAHSPVKAAFVFDGDRKGVLKKSGSVRRSSVESGSQRHVRFSTATTASYPSSPKEFCISPRLRRAREEFNAFLEAQNV